MTLSFNRAKNSEKNHVYNVDFLNFSSKVSSNISSHPSPLLKHDLCFQGQILEVAT